MAAALFVLDFEIYQFNVDRSDFLFDFFDVASGFCDLLMQIDVKPGGTGNQAHHKDNQHEPADLGRELGVFACDGTLA